MVTTKKTPITKKSSTKPVKNAKTTARPWSWRFSFVTVGIYTIVVSTVVVAALLASSTLLAQESKSRLNRIEDIYASLKLDDGYRVEASDVFGDKRVYSWDKGRTYSSLVQYLHGDTVSNTVADLDGRIKAAGFTFINEPYVGSAFTEYHYKSKKGEYIRINVSSKPYDDAWTNADLMKQPTDNFINKFDTNAGPSSVTIKVNLDDNKE